MSVVFVGAKKPLNKSTLKRLLKEKLLKKKMEKLITLYLELIENTLTMLILSTPVDTGRARLHWKVDVQKDEKVMWDLKEAERKKSSHHADAKNTNESNDLQIGVHGPLTQVLIKGQMARAEAALRQQIYSKGTTRIVFSNPILYIKYLEGGELGKTHPSGLVPWSKQNNQFTMKAANWLRRFGIPDLRKRINATNKSN